MTTAPEKTMAPATDTDARAVMSGAAGAGADRISALAHRLLLDAVKRGASDVHINCLADVVTVRFRINGILHDAESLDLDTGRRLTHHLKAISGMNIIERRRPQDGRVLVEMDGGEIDFRLATINVLWGENLAIRIFDKRGPVRDLDSLGVSSADFPVLLDLIRSPKGLLLVTGPTGAGKTTTLCSILSYINRPEINVLTVEDPVEYEMPRINQIGIHPEIGIGFVECLRAAIRQDPDVLMVGEIRDTETARIAIRAALSGHVVFSTLHTGVAAEGITAMINLGIEPFLLATSLVGVIAQQLVRTVCSDCRCDVPLEVTADQLDPVFQAEFYNLVDTGRPIRFSYGEGCDACFDSGYRSRTGIFEILRVTPAVRRLILDKRPAGEIEELATSEGMASLRTQGVRMVLDGHTTIEEVLRVVPVPETNADAENAADPVPAL